jgi:pyruvate,water dikinase
MGDPAAVEALNAIWADPRLQPQRRGIRFHARTQIARFLVPVLGNVLLNLISPDQRREYIVNRGESVLQVVRERCAALQGDRRARLSQLTQLVPELLDQYLPKTFRLFVSGIAAGMASLNMLSAASRHAGPDTEDGQKVGWSDLILKVAGGIPHNPTTEMDLALWQTAQLIKKDPLSWDVFQQAGIPELTARYQARTLPDAAQQAVDQFLGKYGGRGLAEIDAGRARWAEEPAHIFDALTGYLQIEDVDRAPDAVFKRSAVAATAAIDQLVSSVEKGPRGWFKKRQIRFAARRARALLGVRESPKFFAVRFLAIFRWELLKLGSEFGVAGELDQADDLVFLSLNEIRAFAAGEPNDWRGLIAKRRLDYQRELQRRQIPRVLLSDGQAFYEGISAPGDAATMLTGSPVSSGSVEGNVRVVLDPRHAGLLPGEILVCPGTDPAWTPLFLTAGGLVMEVGGLMTHGSVVAREYGIPAVVGVHQATTRLKTGQRIRVDGNSGKIVILSG